MTKARDDSAERESFAELTAAFLEADEPDDGRVPRPDGRYDCEFAAYRLTRARRGKNAGATMLSLGFQVQTGEFEGKWIWDSDPLVNDAKKLGYIKRKLRYLGVEISRLENLPATLEEAKGTLVEIRLVTKNSYQNVYVQPPSSEPFWIVSA